KHGPPHHVWTELRAKSPVHRCETDVYPPFWAITKHEDIVEISTCPETFLNQHGIVLLRKDQPRSTDGIGAMRTIIEMDPPEHRSYRKVVSSFFTPRAIQRLEQAAETSAREIFDRLAGDTGEGECDLATDVAAPHPLRLLSTILGVPRSQEPDILRLTSQLFAADDEELRRPGVSREQAIAEIGAELYGIFDEVIKQRRANPTDDLISLIANGTVDGQPMGPLETFGYCLIVFTAGHDTTKNALAGGLNALIHHPDELRKLRENPDLVGTAVDEVVRWATPVNTMMRTAAHDVEFRGQQIKAGDKLILFYASANRDEDVFDDPFTFRIDRDPNRHLGFGIGEHFCLGAHLARMSQRALFREFARRVEWIEPTAEPTWITSSFVVGFKHVPVRYRIKR
ncbi:MAG TPA: cytochrome P450, partial [Acidimicrobiales bacterium]